MKLETIFLALVTLLVTGCTRIQTGEIGIKKSWDGQVSDQALTNTIEFTVLDTVIVVDGSQVRVLAEDIKAKDVNGVLFADIDVQATYNTKSTGAVAFYKATREVDLVIQNTGASADHVLGYNLVKQELVNATVKAFSKFKASDVNGNKQAIEEEVKKVLVEKLDSRFNGTFDVTNVNINSAQLDPSVEKVLQAQALLDSESRLIGAKMAIQKQQNELLRTELQEMKEIAMKAGVSLIDVMKYRNDKDRNRVLSELSKNSPSTQVQVKE